MARKSAFVEDDDTATLDLFNGPQSDAQNEPDAKAPVKDAPPKEAEPKGEEKPEPKEASEEAEPRERPKDTPEQQLAKLQKALDEARSDRRELKKAQKEQETRYAQLNEGWQKFQAALARQHEQDNAPPPYESDPLENLNQRVARLTQENEQLRMQSHQTAQQWQAQMQRQNFIQNVVAQVGEYKKEHPDYDDAYSHVMNVRRAELASLVPSEHIGQALAQWEEQLASIAMRSGKNPAEVIYAQASALGYKPKGAAAGDAQASDGGAKAAEDLKRLAKGQDAARSLTGSKGGEAELSLESLRDMDEAQMSELVSKHWGKLARLMQ